MIHEIGPRLILLTNDADGKLPSKKRVLVVKNLLSNTFGATLVIVKETNIVVMNEVIPK